MRLNDMVGSERQRIVVVVGLVAVVLAAGTYSVPRATGGEPWLVEQRSGLRVPVVMVALDELPLGTLMTESGEIDPSAFPNFARLADLSTWFRNTTTPVPFTLEALPAILTGVPERIADSDRRTRDLFTLLGDRYPVRTAGTAVPWCSPELCEHHTTDANLPEDFYLYSSAGRGRDVAAFLEVIGRRGPSFSFLHLVMPHGPLRYLPSGQRYPEAEAEPGEVNPPGRGRAWGPYPWLVKFGFQRHLLQTMLTDRALGLILDRLQEAGTLDRTLLVVMADHGLGFVPRTTKRVVTSANVNHVAYVPLFVKFPGQSSGAVSDLPLETTDVAATITDALGLSHGPDGSGRSALSGPILAGRVRSSGGVLVPPGGSGVYDLVRFKTSAFATDAGLDPYSLAPRGLGHLIGDYVDPDLPFGGTRVAANVAVLEDAHPEDILFPALFEGRLLGRNEASPERLAIAVNDRIVAVTRTTRWRRADRFYVILDPAKFSAPSNEISIFTIDDSGALGRVEIHPDAGLLTDLLIGG